MNLTNSISGFAMLALAALPIASLPASALAAPAPASVKIADINLLTPQGMATFDKRADYAARDFCREERSLSVAAACRVAVKEELAEKVTAIRSARLEQASKTFAAR
ncbi:MULTISPECIES: UrcA family protein [unclassified Phenylobacterium]|uniref:UrcA family protein n=1 Tax=unclassified Phenylobacterium TaxID=2640670 RepID=UPI00083A43D3|nr:MULTISPECIES: UrcA family protein [unclassified Phenylobacterium]